MASTITINGKHFAHAVTAASSAQAQQQAASVSGAGLPVAADLVGVALPRLGPGDLQTTIIPSGFLQFASDNLGNEGSQDDGFDLILANAVLGVDDDEAGVSTMLPDIMDADFIGGDVAATTFAPVTQSINDYVAGGDTLITALDGAVTPTGNPPPPPPPPPDGGGGGGGGGGDHGDQGGGGGGGGGGIKCSIVSNPITNEFIGVDCESVPGGGPGVHQPLLE